MRSYAARIEDSVEKADVKRYDGPACAIEEEEDLWHTDSGWRFGWQDCLRR